MTLYANINMNNKNRKVQRQTRVRKKTAVVTTRPRLSVFRSNNYVYAQIVDGQGNTVAGVSEKTFKKATKVTPIESAKQVGVEIAKLALSKKRLKK